MREGIGRIENPILTEISVVKKSPKETIIETAEPVVIESPIIETTEMKKRTYRCMCGLDAEETRIGEYRCVCGKGYTVM